MVATGVNCIPQNKEFDRLILFLFRWTEPDPKKRFVPLLSSAGSIWNSYNPEDEYEDFSFSPDGKWVVFKDSSKNYKNPVFVALPIDEKNPLYVGKPIKLGNATREGARGPTSTCWATGPTAFVMCDGLAIYKWDLGNVHTMKHVKMPADAKSPF